MELPGPDTTCRCSPEAEDEDRMGEATACRGRGRDGPGGELIGATEDRAGPR